MPIEDFQRAAASTGYSLSAVPAMMERFGSSFEATVFRLASAHPEVAVAGLLQYRLRVGEQRQKRAERQAFLFSPMTADCGEELIPKYRRQSIYLSEACGEDYLIRWNKSFPLESAIYKAHADREVHAGRENLPNDRLEKGQLGGHSGPLSTRRGRSGIWRCFVLLVALKGDQLRRDLARDH